MTSFARLIALATALAALAFPPAAHAATVTLAPSWGSCGGAFNPSQWPNPVPEQQSGNTACDRTTGAAHLSAQRSDLIEGAYKNMRAQVHMYAGDVVPEGVSHRRYTATIHVDEAWVRGITGPAGSRIDATISTLPIDCDCADGQDAAGITIVGGPLAPASIQDQTLTIVLDLKADPLRPGSTLPSGRYSIFLWLGSDTFAANAGDSSLLLSISSAELTAQTIA